MIARSSGRGIGAAGHVVGFAMGADGKSRAFLNTPERGTLDLNTFLPSSSGWTLMRATAINDEGQITGEGINPGGQARAFLLSPVR